MIRVEKSTVIARSERGGLCVRVGPDERGPVAVRHRRHPAADRRPACRRDSACVHAHPHGQADDRRERVRRVRTRQAGGLPDDVRPRLLASYSVEPTPAGTRLTATIELDVSGIMSVAEPLVARALRRDVDANLARLRAILDASATDLTADSLVAEEI